MTRPEQRALAPFRVVDLSRVLAGPFAAQLLADLGATVIKVEPPGGDPTRAWGPPFAPGEPADDPKDSAYFRCANRGKRGVVIDLGSERGKEELSALLETADVLVENFLPASARRLGLSFDALHARFPKLVVASVRGFASDTRAAERPGYDFLAQAESGWMAATGVPAADGGAATKVGMALIDVLAGLYLANGIQAALLRRERGGAGCHVEVPLMEAALAGLVNVGAAALMTGEPTPRFGNAHPHIVPYQSFACSDGSIAVAAGNDRQFAALMDALGLVGEFAAHPEWRNNPGRVRDRSRLVPLLERAFAALSCVDAIARCALAGVPAGPVRDARDVLLDRSGDLHRAVVDLRDPATGDKIAVVASPIQLDGLRACSPLPPPPWER